MARTRSRYNYQSNFEDWERDAGDGYEFADPGSQSALRAARPGNPRIYSCPTCKQRRVLTRRDKELGYQCNSCADRQERGGY